VNIDVEFIGFPEMKALIGQKRISLDFDGETFIDLIKKLEGMYRSTFKKSILNREGLVDSTVQILRNDSKWVKRDNSSQRLSDGDKIIFLRMMGGG
jgi:molybdopterin converting factor small subunit